MFSVLSIHCNNHHACRFAFGTHDRNATVIATYNKTANATTGFATLDISSPKDAPPRAAAYAAGLAEGYQTAAEIALFYTNVYEFGPSGPSAKLTKFVKENDAWTRAQAKAKASSDDYWMGVGLVLDRFDGTLAGYEKARDDQPSLPLLSKLDLLWINLDGDLFDLQRAVGEEASLGRGGRAARLLRGNATDRVLRCSSLFKLTEDRTDLFFGHATWDTYATAAPRIFKHLTLPAPRQNQTQLRTVSMSSSPGFMASIDDCAPAALALDPSLRSRPSSLALGPSLRSQPSSLALGPSLRSQPSSLALGPSPHRSTRYFPHYIPSSADYLVAEPAAGITLGVIETSISIDDASACECYRTRAHATAPLLTCPAASSTLSKIGPLACRMLHA